ncbi:MAG: hypothetical protein ACLUFI_05730 [Oscillospiraceae bacterium]
MTFLEVFQKADTLRQGSDCHPAFSLLLQKKTLAKEKEPEGISISPQTPLNRPEKPLRFFWTFPAIAENPMRIRTAQFLSAGRFTANIQTQLLTNPLSRIRRRVQRRQ